MSGQAMEFLFSGRCLQGSTPMASSHRRSEHRRRTLDSASGESFAGCWPISTADATYDIVTLWDVIEHVEDPLGLLISAMAHLRPGGWLVVETGNYQSADACSPARPGGRITRNIAGTSRRK